MQFTDIMPNITNETLRDWFLYNPDEPMLFSTAKFLRLFVIFYAVYILIKGNFKARIIFTAAFSLYFYYLCSEVYFILLIFSSVVDYTLSYFLYREQRVIQRKVYLWFSVIVNLTFLGYFKYNHFILDGAHELFGLDYTIGKVMLPVGISFYTFQSISYIIEIYRKEITPAKDYLDYLFFVSFFPQLVAGPIVRAKDFIPQIYAKLELTKADVNNAFFLIIGGLIKKTVISDYISLNFVDRVFDAPNSYTAFENLMAAYGYTIQIYCDFSGYSDMAIGIALLLGFKLPTNFRTPYKSASITEFWRRWHISLSTWLKDFLYISVGGNRHGSFAGFLFPALFFFGLVVWGIQYSHISSVPLIVGVASTVLFSLTFLLAKQKEKTMYTNVNLFTTMLLGGLWHGASMRFIIWGALHGLALAVHKLWMEFFPKKETENKSAAFLWKIIAVILTFHFVAFCWIFFRAKDFTTALELINNIGNLTFEPDHWQTIILGYKNVFGLMVIGYAWHLLPQSFSNSLNKAFFKTPLLIKAILLGFVFWLVYAAASAGPQPFIYFQF
ncbi:MBOAT family protein [Flavobacterium sp. Sd200]|uniref:MBOAT family O-acyltransferase n=1 Tax=Flavobacterium sp. Sd200 TaxID=2692211 RepID=UPI00136E8042|nr:MBOAT family protein [Flavobacterium sp. Sd200]MXN92202.1 MBOAT family protein [Flavobacterium sp. Sd200]